MKATLRPVAEGERVELFDALRGFALLGILLVNFAGARGTRFPQLDAFMRGALDVLVSGSFYPLYSFLFGLGFAVQLANARARGTGSSHLYFRRMLVLFLIGTAHATLIWQGDILTSYSIMGLALIPVHRLPQKGVFLLALALFVIGLWRPHIWVASEAARAENTQLVGLARAVEERITLDRAWTAEAAQSAYAQAVRTRWQGHLNEIRGHADWRHWLLSRILLCFLIGLMVGRSRVLHEPRVHRRPLFIAAGVATVVAATGAVAYNLGWTEGRLWLNHLAGEMATPGLTAFYVLAITLLFTFTARGRRAFGLLVPAGRMGLTNYLMQSVVMTALSAPYALGWTPTTTLWIAINLAFFFGVQVPLSRWWLARYRYGPAEWLWRSATYGAAQPFRRQPAAPAPAPAAAVA